MWQFRSNLRLLLHHQISNSSSLNSNTTTSSQELAEKFPSYIENVSSIANSCFFLIVFSILMSGIAIFIYKTRHVMKRNHKILFVWMSIFVVVQSLGLIFRLVYNGIGLKINSFQDLTTIQNLNEIEIAMWVFSTLEVSMVYSQIATIIMIMAFIMLVFLKTMRLSGAMSKQTYTKLWRVITSITIICEIVFIGLVFTMTITDLLMKMPYFDFDVIAIYSLVFTIYIVVMVLETVMFTLLGIRLLYIVKHRSLQNKTVTNHPPYGKIIGLIIGMILSAFLQFLAGGVSFATSLYVPYLHIIDYFLQCFGVFIFAVFVLLLYGPLLNNEQVQSNLSELQPPQSPISPSASEKWNASCRDLKAASQRTVEHKKEIGTVAEINNV